MSNDQSTSKITKAQVSVPASFSDKFTWQKAALRDPELSMSAKLVAVALFNHHNETSGQCNPGQECLADDTSITLRGVNGAIRSLREGGWITAHTTGRENWYVLEIDRAKSVKAADTGKDRRSRYEKIDVADEKDSTHQIRKDRRTNHQEKSQKKSQPNHRPVGEEIPAGSMKDADAALETTITSNPPDMPKAANDDTAGVIEVAGLPIPVATIAKWRDVYVELGAKLMIEVTALAKWVLGRDNIRPDQRISRIEAALARKNEETRAAKIKAESGRCLVTDWEPPQEPVGKHDLGRQLQKTAFAGRHFSLSRQGIRNLEMSFPALDITAEIHAFDEQAGRYQSREEMQNAIGPWLKQRHQNAQTRKAA